MPSNLDPSVLEGIQRSYEKITKRMRRLREADRIVDDLNIDSIAKLELLVDIEDRFGIQLFDDPRARQLDTVGDLAALVTTIRETISP